MITVAVHCYLRYRLSYRDLEELLAERGAEIDHVSVYWWVKRFTLMFADAARPTRLVTGGQWFIDGRCCVEPGRARLGRRSSLSDGEGEFGELGAEPLLWWDSVSPRAVGDAAAPMGRRARPAPGDDADAGPRPAD